MKSGKRRRGRGGTKGKKGGGMEGEEKGNEVEELESKKNDEEKGGKGGVGELEKGNAGKNDNARAMVGEVGYVPSVGTEELRDREVRPNLVFSSSLLHGLLSISCCPLVGAYTRLAC